MKFSSTKALGFAILLALGLGMSRECRAGVVYLALGDSTTFGNDESLPSSTTPNIGDQGFVRHFADFLGSVNGGVRPQVTNLAISGELSSSFLTGVPPADWPNRAVQWNLNYPTPTTSQNSLMLTKLDAAHAAGNSVYVTLEFGGNDYNYLVTTTAFQMANAADQQAMIGQLFNQVVSNYATVLTEIKAHAPGAHILLPGFFNNILPTDPGYASSEALYVTANQILQQQLAPPFGATYVDLASVIEGNVVAYTNYNNGVGGHPNQAGYAAIALALDAAAVPEPSSLSMLAVGLAGFGLRRRFRRA